MPRKNPSAAPGGSPAAPAIAPAKRGRGRPRKALAPAGPTAAPATPAPTPLATLTATREAQLARIQDKAAGGAALAHHEERQLREAWILAAVQSDALWAGLDACAAEFRVSPSTVRNWVAEGCPAIEPHSPIPKAAVYRWHYQRGTPAGGGVAPAHQVPSEINADQIDLELKRAKLLKQSGQLIAEAEDRARQAVIQMVSGVRQILLHQLPGAAVEAMAQALTTGDRLAAEDHLRRAIETALAQGRSAALRSPEPEPTPDADDGADDDESDEP